MQQQILGRLAAVQTNLFTLVRAQWEEHGRRVGRRPWTAIIITILLTLLAALGLFNFHRVSDVMSLWIPVGSAARLVRRHF